MAPAFVFALALVVTALLLVSTTRSIRAKDQAAFETEATRTADAARERIETTVTLLYGVAGLFAASDHVGQQQFSAYVGQLDLRRRYPGIQGIGWSARFMPAQVPGAVARRRAEGLGDFHVWPEEPRDEYHSILYLEPQDARNVAAIGYDMFTDPVRRAAMANARDAARAVASGQVTLVQEINAGKQSGFLIFLPVYRGRTAPPDLEARRRNLAGFVYSPLRAGDLLEGIRGAGARELDYELYDSAELGPESLLRSTREAGSPVPEYSTVREFNVAGRRWHMRMSSRPAFEALSQRRLVPWLGGLSFGASVLLAWVTLVQVRARRDAELASSERRRNELALRASQEQALERASRLQQLYAELREGDRRKDEFLAILAHELRNPLAPIRNALEILNRTPDPEPARRARDILGRQVRHMVRLIDDLLDVSRISRGKIVLQRQSVALVAVVDAAVETSRPLIDARGHRFTVVPVDPDIHLHVDPTRIGQILTNLLNNAAHYTPPGGRIDLAARQDGDTVRISVRDSGVGIEPSRLQQVFGLFEQVDRHAGGGGLGIGLNLSAGLAALHGGRIEAHSEGLGRGSEFVLVLPLANAAAAAGTADAQHGPGEQATVDR
ncbi:MAG TPA: CHASE domain-containing protein [Ramlibacter sp.]|jgi:signal transduction histidine kinase|uniref:CHASE domain-containing protein n=1 Tax=Ramlibacter sp. TaxID=1917967 RepID=UPI002D25A0CE|nr:CHASE domain-containing protein [Ramlibacter sp.]HZY19313.1 CHASE domain-containing protein [Ramlibacter sp.]